MKPSRNLNRFSGLTPASRVNKVMEPATISKNELMSVQGADVKLY